MPYTAETVPAALIPFDRNMLLVVSRDPHESDPLPFHMPSAEEAERYSLVILYVAADKATLFEPVNNEWNATQPDTDMDSYHARFDDPSRSMRCVLLDEDGHVIMARPCPICEYRLFDTLAEAEARKAQFTGGTTTQAVA